MSPSRRRLSPLLIALAMFVVCLLLGTGVRVLVRGLSDLSGRPLAVTSSQAAQPAAGSR